MHTNKQTKKQNKQNHYSRSEMQSAPSTTWIYKWSFLEMASAYGNLWKPKRKDATVYMEKGKKKAIVFWKSKYRLHIYLSMEDKLSQYKYPCVLCLAKTMNSKWKKQSNKKQSKQSKHKHGCGLRYDSPKTTKAILNPQSIISLLLSSSSILIHRDRSFSFQNRLKDSNWFSS